jgi:hypothetical protein
MRRERARGGQSRDESGFALILAILALLLLTFLGLTLATTTSTEFQIAFNYQASQQALYNAEAGVEAAKGLLRTLNWSAVVPTGRGTSWDGATTPSGRGGGASSPFSSRPDQWGNLSRDFENWQCDRKGNGMGYGVVLDDGSPNAPYQYVSTIFGKSLGVGGFTVWVRRPLKYNPDATLTDYNDDNDNLILVAEGVAPLDPTNPIGSRRAVQVIEVTLSRGLVTAATCLQNWAQSGGSALGNNAQMCEGLDAVTGGEQLIRAMGEAPGEGDRGTGQRQQP